MSERKPTSPDDPRRGDFDPIVPRSNRDRHRDRDHRRSSSACSVSISVSSTASASTASSRTPALSQKQPKKQKQPSVVITAMSSSPMPDLSSASPSPSISSVDTRPGTGVESPHGDTSTDGIYVLGGMTLITPDSPLEPALSRASLSSWDTTAAASISSATPSIPISLTATEQRTYACLFHMLDCHESFDDGAEWRIHVFSHFRSHPTPPSARCPLCPNTKFVDGISDPVSSPVPEGAESAHSSDGVQALTDSPSAWERMLDHVDVDHYCLGQTLAGSRPDFELMRYLYGMRVITDAQFKAMQLPPAPSSPAYHRSQDGVRASIGSADEPYCAPYSKRREERMRGQQRGVGVL
ncbi:Zinc finger C2H2 [Penicillium cf. griseofulvum]|uniref:Zinc finger C2H2 n=1 Tax=Penicillium cf. griseofulvum TaxID=2972120 RepID=A0A9W9MPY9_9EURO|nr:Zinc finger C2H2 [Penicillium cf. griseofulvum]KAJ5437522.1 Zinc finger C2H2 [Penicillium cf. griseofulvum]KAJ5441666.1 Zinc finger C2H2 [Penicillium cf. griseofulvum]